MQQTIEYIIQFLTRDEQSARQVGYTDDKTQWSKYKVVIIPSNFFDSNIYGSEKSMPSLPLKEVEGIPLLFGEPKIELSNNTVICYADIIASTYFLVSRYEEYINPISNRDIHGRYIGKNSIPNKANFIHRPIVDEYGQLLRTLLQQTGVNLSTIPQTIDHIYLTHDVDSITNYRRLRGFLGGIFRSITKGTDSLSIIAKSLIDIHNDPAYTFSWILKQDNLLRQASQIYFIKACSNAKSLDKPTYNLRGNNFKQLIQEIQKLSPNVIIGLHSSYISGDTPKIIPNERQLLQNAIPGREITTARHHYLRSLQPQDMESLIDANITDDYTMGYADIAGFRLGTCRSVRFINPETKTLRPLTIHPLTVMDCTLSEPNYMNLSYDDALRYTLDLIQQIKLYNGDVCLLWHNTRFTHDNYHTRLYTSIITELCKSETF